MPQIIALGSVFVGELVMGYDKHRTMQMHEGDFLSTMENLMDSLA